MFELNRRYTLDMPKGSISHAGTKKIMELIHKQRMTSDDDWKARNPDNMQVYLMNLPDDWQWVWLVTGKGDYVGTFTKRVGKYYYKTQNLNCPRSFLQAIGNIARQHTEDNPLYVFEFVKRFDWKAGDYGDGGSCFWGGNGEARRVIAENGGLAIRFYDDNDNGIARAWIAPISDGRYVLFNGYGFAGNPTLICAHVLATLTGLSYKKIYLSNHNRESGLVHINGGIGYLIGQPGQIEPVVRYDLDWFTGDVCSECGRDLYDDEVYVGLDDGLYCENCYEERFRECDRCYGLNYRDDLIYVEYDSMDVCSACFDRYYSSCENCGHDYPRDLILEVNDRYLCENCREDLEPDDSESE